MTLTEIEAKLTGLATKYHIRDAALLAGRLLLSILFLHEGVTLASHFGAAARAMAAQGIGLPLFVATLGLQLCAGFAIAAGLLTRLAAIGLGLFCLATAMLFHTSFASQNELLHFEKDLAIAGGMFVLAATGAGRLSLDRLLAGALRRRRDRKMAATPAAKTEAWAGEVKLPV